MHIKKIPQVYRNFQDSSITISYGKPFCSMIWLHGLCDTSQGFYSFFTHSSSPVYSGMRVKLIQAPLRYITINNGQICHSWYDITSTNRFSGDQKKAFNFNDIQQSLKIIEQHVEDEVNQWNKDQTNSKINPFHRVYVGGFSQGGVMSLTYSMQSKVPPAGAICFSGYMLRQISYKNFQKFPSLLMHGSKDPIIRQVMAKKSYQKLLTAQNLMQYHLVEGLEHTVNLNQLQMLNKWVQSTFKQIRMIYEAANS